MSGHDGGDRTGEGAALGAFVAVAVAHDERTEVGVTEAEGAEDVAVFRDVFGRVAGVVDEDFLRGDVDAHGGFEFLDVEGVVFAFELHQVE